MSQQSKINRLLTLMNEKKAIALLAVSPQNVHYLSGFYTIARPILQIGQTACLLNNLGEVTLFLPEHWGEDFKPEYPCTIVEYKGDVDNLAFEISRYLPHSFCCDVINMSYSLHHALCKISCFDIRNGTDIFNRCRMIKEEEEIQLLNRAVSLIDLGLSVANRLMPCEMSELEVQAKINSEMLLNGSSGNGFTTKVLSGANGSYPYHVPIQKTIECTDSVIVDLSATVEGYESDSARTFLLKNVPPEVLFVHEKISDLLESLPSFLSPGCPISELSAFLRSSLKEISPTGCQAQTLGHGVGLDAHEYPDITSNSTEVLQKQTILAIEPAIYVGGEFGVRIENMFLISAGKTEVINQFPINRYSL